MLDVIQAVDQRNQDIQERQDRVNADNLWNGRVQSRFLPPVPDLDTAFSCSQYLSQIEGDKDTRLREAAFRLRSVLVRADDTIVRAAWGLVVAKATLES